MLYPACWDEKYTANRAYISIYINEGEENGNVLATAFINSLFLVTYKKNEYEFDVDRV